MRNVKCQNQLTARLKSPPCQDSNWIWRRSRTDQMRTREKKWAGRRTEESDQRQLQPSVFLTRRTRRKQKGASEFSSKNVNMLLDKIMISSLLQNISSHIFKISFVQRKEIDQETQDCPGTCPGKEGQERESFKINLMSPFLDSNGSHESFGQSRICLC